MKRIALLGGSFDPVHEGHLNMARAALAHLDVEEVWFIPSQSTPLKDRDLLPAEFRLGMLKEALKEDPRFKLCTVDLMRNGKSYTCDTLKILHEQFPHREFIWLLGADQAEAFHQWKEADTLSDLAKFVSVDRNGKEPHNDHGFVFESIPMEPTPVSSTQIRQGSHINYLPQGVLQYILDHELYVVNWVAAQVNPRRLAHSASVARLCRQLAQAHGLDPHRAWLMGLFHDVAKDMPRAQLEKWIRATVPEALEEHPAIWHGYVGAQVVQRIYGIHDDCIANGIHNHVKGTSYDPYAMICFIADKLDPLRGYDSSGLIRACMHDLYNGFMLVKKENKAFLEKEEQKKS